MFPAQEEMAIPKTQYHVSRDLNENVLYLNKRLSVDDNFDIIYRVIDIGGKKACMYFINGLCKDELMQKMLEGFMSIPAKEMPDNAHEFSKKFMPYIEVDLSNSWKDIVYFLLSGVFVLIVDGYDKVFLIDSRTYPSRSVAEPEKDKVLRGSKDGFVETVISYFCIISISSWSQ